MWIRRTNRSKRTGYVKSRWAIGNGQKREDMNVIEVQRDLIMRRSELMRKGWRWWFLISLVCLFPWNIGCNKSSKVESHSSAAPKGSVPAITFGDKFYDVSAGGKGNVWVVGYYGAIVHSNDGGKIWSRQDSGSSNSLLGVAFVNEREGWVVGELGVILHTKDGGVKWENQQSPVPDQRLLKVQFISEREGWVVGTYGVILHTLDGGAHWEKLPFKEDITLNDLSFLNSSEGWVVGEFETILHTTDGGRTWQKQRGDKEGQLFGIGFMDALSGVAVGTSGKILLTTDGGKSWREIKSPIEDTLLQVKFHGQSQAIAIGLRGVVVRSSIGGANDKPTDRCRGEHARKGSV
jgi:photosystem II stability/assembly factor-like uncharacterized protein